MIFDSSLLFYFRIAISFLMLVVGSYFDIKTRKIDDKIWLIFAIPGILLNFLEPISAFTLFFLFIGIVIGVAIFFTRIFGQADGLAIITLSLITPSILIPLVALAIVLLGIYGTIYNVALNLLDLLQGRLFPGVNEKAHRKILAFLIMHRRRYYEKFVIKSQIDNRFLFHHRPEENFSANFDGLVFSAFPMLPFMLASFVFILVIENFHFS